MVKIDPADDAPEGLTGKEFIEYMKNKKPVPTATVADEEVEPIAKPTIKGKQVGQMRATKGGKPAGEATEFGGHEEGIDASEDTFEGEHPTLAKAVDIGKKVVGTINEKTAGYVKDTEGIDRKLKELERKRQGDGEEEKKSSKKKSSKKSKGKILDEDDFDFDDEDDEDITALNKATSKQKVLPGNYKPAYGSGMGSGSYKSVFKGELGGGTYQPAYKTVVRERPDELTDVTRVSRARGVKSAVEELTPREERVATRQSDRFNMQNWQSLGFPNTLPQSARGSLFRPAPQQQVVPMVRQPYQPREEPTQQPARAPMVMPRIGMGLFTTPRVSMPARAPLSGPMPRIGLNINTAPQIMRPRTTVAPPRAPVQTHTIKAPVPTPMTFMGVTLGEKKKQEPKPITNMGAGYKHVPLVVMNGIYPNAGYNPKADPITKKSIIPKIQATVTPNNFTMFGMRMKNRKV